MNEVTILVDLSKLDASYDMHIAFSPCVFVMQMQNAGFYD